MQQFSKYNKVWFGLILGVVVPFVGYAVLLMVNEQLGSFEWEVQGNQFEGFSEKLLRLLAICLNLIPFTWGQRQRMDNLMRGVFVPTIIYVMVWMVLHSAEIFSE